MLILTTSEFETKISATFFQNPKVSRTHKQNAKKTHARRDQRVVFFIANTFSLSLTLGSLKRLGVN